MKKLILLCILFSTNAFADKYGMAGCGLGSLILNDKPGKIQILSGILNSWGSQTSAITTGTSNCTESAGSVADLKYIEDNKQALQLDIAQGNGETLAGLLTLWKCNSEAAQNLKANYSTIFAVENKAVVQVRDTMKKSLNSSCQKI
jgi:hypothetical protein